jgi:hypothetical protein
MEKSVFTQQFEAKSYAPLVKTAAKGRDNISVKVIFLDIS